MIVLVMILVRFSAQAAELKTPKHVVLKIKTLQNRSGN
jgi:hypothetical protein